MSDEIVRNVCAVWFGKSARKVFVNKIFTVRLVIECIGQMLNFIKIEKRDWVVGVK